MKYWIIGGAVFIAFWVYSDHQKTVRQERAAARVAACERDPFCAAAKRDSEARSYSFGEDVPIRSHSGALFFKGERCLDDCSGHMAGYAWAEENDITDSDDCSGNSASFIEGCVSYTESLVEDEDSNDDDDPRESCTPGRYGDC